MAQARWIGVDGIDERTLGPYWGIGLRHDLADAARDYDWPRVLHILSAHRDWINASRPGGRARYAPLHQAAHGGAPAPVIHRLIGMGAWRTLRNRRGERPVDIARRRGHVRLVPILKPVCPRHDVPLDALNRVQGHFHALIREYPAGRKRGLRLPELEPLLEMGRESVYFEVLGMFGGFVYSLEEDGTVPRLMVERFSRVLTCHRFEITPDGCTPVDSSDGLPGRSQTHPAAVPPLADYAREEPLRRDFDDAPPASRVDAPAQSGPPDSSDMPLASVRLANGDTGFVELSPEGVRRLARSEGSVVRLSNEDVVQRHRHASGIKCMSLNRLMRLREESRESRPGAGSTSRRELAGDDGG